VLWETESRTAWLELDGSRKPCSLSHALMRSAGDANSDLRSAKASLRFSARANISAAISSARLWILRLVAALADTLVSNNHECDIGTPVSVERE